MPSPDTAGQWYVGLMSGTSMDGIDAALVEFGVHSCSVLATQHTPYPGELKKLLLHASRTPAECTVDVIGHLDHWVGECLQDAVLGLLDDNSIDAGKVTAIGSHGQTLRHQPRASRPFTLQIGDANIIASGTGISVVADFRRRDIAVGGEGAPLAPAFHHWLLAQDAKDRAVVNIGGIANVTMISGRGEPTIGFDTGPGNTLLDGWIRKCRDIPYDDQGQWSASGQVNDSLLEILLGDPYFAMPSPKSTGFEYFNGSWLSGKLDSVNAEVSDQDVQATLAELSARTIALAILDHAPGIEEVLVCGGGIHNSDLIDRLSGNLPDSLVSSTEKYGLHPDWVEAAAFAWLAKRCIERESGNLPSVTGADQAVILGAIYG